MSLAGFMQMGVGGAEQRGKAAVREIPVKKKKQHRRRKTQSLYEAHGIVPFSWNVAAQNHPVTFSTVSPLPLISVRLTFS